MRWRSSQVASKSRTASHEGEGAEEVFMESPERFGQLVALAVRRHLDAMLTPKPGSTC